MHARRSLTRRRFLRGALVGAGAALVSDDDILEGMALWLADGLPPLA